MYGQLSVEVSFTSQSQGAKYKTIQKPHSHSFIFYDLQHDQCGLDKYYSCSAYPVKNFSPALHGDTLVDGQHSKPKVIKVSDAMVGSCPWAPALRTRNSARAPMTWGRTWSWFFTFHSGQDIWGRKQRAKCETLWRMARTSLYPYTSTCVWSLF